MIKEKLREFGLTSLAVDNATSVFLITFMILLFGVQSYNDMPKEQYPETTLPTVFINTPYFGNSAKEIESFITRPIEKEIQSLSGLKDITSTSIQDYSVIIAEFDGDIEMEEVVRKIKDAVDKSKSELPNDLTRDPEILEINFAELPIVTVNVSGQYPPDDLKRYAEYLQDKIEALREVSEVDLKGAQEREVRVDVDLLKMQSLRVSFNDIESAISYENRTMSGGEIVASEFRRSVRVVGQFETVEEIANIIVKSERQKPIYLRDIADVTFGFKDRSSYSRAEGLPVVSLDVVKRRGGNLLSVADEIKSIIAEYEKVLPDDIEISLFNDQSVATRNEVTNLENSVISGVILVVLVLLFFLGLRNSLFVGLAIPLSMLMGIMGLFIIGTTMNMVVLFALILALGLLVDNGIVVVENIYRYMQDGYSSKEAAKYGAGEVALPIIASTATTLAAFLPLAFWPGIMGKFMKYLPITLIVVLSSSLFVALVINPVFTSRFMKIENDSFSKDEFKRKVRNVLLGVLLMVLLAIAFHFGGVNWMRNILGFGAIITTLNFFILRPVSNRFQNSFLPRLERFYNRFIGMALRKINPVLILLGTFVLMVASGYLMVANAPKVELFPEADPLYVNAFVELPQGTDIAHTNEVVREIEKQIQDVVEEDRDIVESILVQIGENTSDPNQPPEPGLTPHKARITITFVPSQDRGGKSSRATMDKIRASVKGYPGVKISVDQNPSGPPTGKPINIEIYGEDVDSLVVLSDNIRKYLNNQFVPGVENLQLDVALAKPELLVNIDREAARRFEVSTAQIGGAIRTSVFGKEVSKFKDGDDDYPIMVRLKDEYRYNVSNLLNQKITFRTPSTGRINQVPISAVADISYNSTYNSIKRKGNDRSITLFSNVLDGYNTNEVVAEIQDLMLEYKMPDGYTYAFTGEQQQQAEDMAFMNRAFLIAVFLIFIIIVAQFNSFISPFIIILSVFFSTIGVFLGYVITGKDIIIIMTGVGVISLAGVVVNNAIVLIDYINLVIKRKRVDRGLASMSEMDKEDVRDAIIKGGSTRLRPVLLTAITTILGLIPLAIGFNINFFTLVTDLDPNFFIGGDNVAMWGPMAWTVIYGLVFATFLTLVVVPVMYWLAYRAKVIGANLFSRN